jgi:hypothetical protein
MIGLTALLSLAAMAPAQNLSTSGNLTIQAAACTGAGAGFVNYLLPLNVSSVAVALSGTWSGTVQFMASTNGSVWASISATPLAGGSPVTSATASGIWTISPGGAAYVCAYASTYTTGPIVVSMSATTAAQASANGGGSGGGNLSGTLTSGYYPLATGTNTLGNGTIDYNVTTPDQVTLDSTQDASTTFYSVSSGETDMVAASGGTAELVLGDPVNGTSLTDTSTHGLELISSGGTQIEDNSSSGIAMYEEGPGATGSYITLYTSSGPILLETGTTFQLLVSTAGNAIDFGITTPNVLTLVAPVLTNGATATTQPAGDSSTKIATTAFVISQGTISAGPGLFGASALNTVIAGTKASQAGHFTNLQVIASLGGTCTTPPQFNVFDGTSNVGTAVTATATTQTKGNATVQAQTRTFAASDQIGIYISTAGATCTTDSFVVTAQYSTP